MKKILASILMLSLVFSLSACNLPWQKKETKKETKKEVIQADKVQGSMEGITLKVGVSDDMAPFSYYDTEQEKIVGFDIDLLDKISQYLGFEYKIYPLSMKQIEKEINNGQIDAAIAGISITDQRQREYSFTDTYYETYLQIVINKKTDITDRKDLKNMKIGVVEGTSSEEYAKEYLSEGNKIKTYKNKTQVFDNLEKDKIDATIYDAAGIQTYMSANRDSTNFQVLDEQLNSQESNYGIMFKKGYQYLDQFNVALQVLNNDGSYQKLKEQWIKTKE